MTQGEKIQAAVLKSLLSRDLYSEQQVNAMLKVLSEAETRVKAELVRIGDGTLLKKGLSVRREQLRGVHQRIDEIVRDLKVNQTLLMKEAVKSSFLNGITLSIGELGKVGLPYYDVLTDADRVKLAGQVMSLVDRSALDFLVNYDLNLLGNVTRELADNIEQQIAVGIVAGDSIAKIGEKIGGVITDPEDFRLAGKTVFKSAQNRIEVITRTETLRAFGQGRQKFYQTVGVTRVVWVTAGDERTCPQCGPLDGQEFWMDKVPAMPHPRCRCTTYAARARVCRSGLPLEAA